MISMMLRFLPISLLLLALPPLVSHAPAQAPGAPAISSSLSARTAAPGQQVVLSYQISGAQPGAIEYPQTIEVPGLSIVFSGQNQRMVAGNGSARAEIVLRYVVQGTEPGEYQIPAQTFKSNGQEMQAAAVSIKISEGEPVSNEFLPTVQLTLGRTEFWKGEVVPVPILCSVTFGAPLALGADEDRSDFLTRARSAVLGLRET